MCRYQYLELAYFLQHGRCPDPYSSEYGYILQENKFSSFDEFYRNTSAALTLSASPIDTQETCMCKRYPGYEEQRHFVYQDIQVIPRIRMLLFFSVAASAGVGGLLDLCYMALSVKLQRCSY